MFPKRHFRSSEIWIFIIAAILMLSLISVIVAEKKQDDTLDVYNTDNTVAETSEIDHTENFETQVYIDDDLGFSLSIPSDWHEVTKSGYPTYVHKESGSSVQIRVLDYDPTVNIMDAETASTNATQNGYTYVSFTRLSDTSYESMYQDKKNSIYDYIEEVHWDREHIVDLYCVFNDENYQKVYPYYETIIKSFSWKSDDAIPDGYYLEYFTDGYEIGVPDNWTTAIDSGAFYADDGNGNSETFQVNTGYTSDLSNLTAVDASSLVSSGKSSFILQSFNTTADQAEVRYSYIENDTNRLGIAYLYADGVNMYALTFDYEDGMMDSSVAETCSGLFRSFLTPDEATESVSGSSHGEIEETDGTKDSESVNSSSAIPEGTEMLPSQNNVGQYYQPDAGQQEMQQSEDGVNQDNQAQGSTNGNATQGMLDKAQQE